MLTAGCTDARIKIPVETPALRYELRWEQGDLRFDDFELVLLHEPFSVPPFPGADENAEIHNGCLRYLWEHDGSVIMFEFVTWTDDNGTLLVDLDRYSDGDWKLVLTNIDGGRIEAEMSGTGGDGVKRRIALSGHTPKSNDGDLCTRNLPSTE